MLTGCGMPENAKVDETFKSFIRMSEALLNMDFSKAMALYLDFIENLTKQVLDFS